jgi:zinc/manganese transport system permease protein
VTSSLLAVEFQSNWLDVLQTTFMRNALIGGSLVAVAAGLLGYFVITRQNAFAAHALAHIGFPGPSCSASRSPWGSPSSASAAAC